MPKIPIHGLEIAYEQSGLGEPLVFIHGAFGDFQIWDPQWRYFAARFRLVRYDLRGHGQTGPSGLESYRISTFVDDLAGLMDGLSIDSSVLCGHSWGGSIALAFAVLHPERVRGLVLAGVSVSIRLTRLDRWLSAVLFPKWAMMASIRLLSLEHFIRLTLGLARLTRGKNWLSFDPATRGYLENCMRAMDRDEYVKIWAALYGFDLLPLERIACPTLVLNGEFEPPSTFQHTRLILQKVPDASARIVPQAGHAMTRDRPEIFDRYVEDFLCQLQKQSN